MKEGICIGKNLRILGWVGRDVLARGKGGEILEWIKVVLVLVVGIILGEEDTILGAEDTILGTEIGKFGLLIFTDIFNFEMENKNVNYKNK